MQEQEEVVKGHVVAALPLRTRWLVAGVAASCAVFALALLADEALPAPRARGDAPPDSFIAEAAYEHLLNLTAIGPRVIMRMHYTRNV